MDSVLSDQNERDQSLEEGHLYTVRNGVLEEIPIDPEDTMRKLRITHSAIEAATQVQRRMRKVLGGYKPDLSMVCSALIEGGAENENATEVVRQYALKTFSSITA